MSSVPAVIGVFDAGIGGFPIAAVLAARGHRIVYLGDAARRPYGPLPNAVVATYVAEAEMFFTASGCDVWAIACNTASVVAGDAVQGLIPCVDMVSAVVRDFPSTGSGPLGLLATAGTVASGVLPKVLASYELHQIATEELLRIAEEGGGDSSRVRALAAEAFETLTEHGCQETVLACTDFTCIIDDMRAAAGVMRVVDPLEAAAQLVEDNLGSCARNGAPPDYGHRLVLTGPHPVDARTYARDRFGLDFPAVEYHPIGPARVAVAGP